LQLIVENDFLVDREKDFSKVKYLISIEDDFGQMNDDPILDLIKETKQ
jgi:hypothetical protein